MRKKRKIPGAALIAGILCITLLSGCSSANKSSLPESKDPSEAPGASQDLSDNTSDTPLTKIGNTSVGEFTTQDINGQTYTQEIFEDYDLTMVNVFATWCSPCVAEMPELEELHQRMADQGVNVIGVVLDVLDQNGDIVPDDLERAQLLVQETGVTYAVLLPDSSYMNGRLLGIEALPDTFFVDKDGNIVSEPYYGSRSLEDWLEVVDTELANRKEGV